MSTQMSCPRCQDPFCRYDAALLDRQFAGERQYDGVPTAQVYKIMDAADEAVRVEALACQDRVARQSKAEVDVMADPEVKAAMQVLAARIAVLTGKPVPQPVTTEKTALERAIAAATDMLGIPQEWAGDRNLQSERLWDALRRLYPALPDCADRTFLTQANATNDRLRLNRSALTNAQWNSGVLKILDELSRVANKPVATPAMPERPPIATALANAKASASRVAGTYPVGNRIAAKQDVLDLLDEAQRLVDKYNSAPGWYPSPRAKDVGILIGYAKAALSKMHPAHVETYWDSFAAQAEAYIDKALVACQRM